MTSGRAVAGTDLEAKLVVDQCDMKRIRARHRNSAGRIVRLDDIVDGDRALVLLVRIAPADGRLVECDGDQPVSARSPSLLLSLT